VEITEVFTEIELDMVLSMLPPEDIGRFEKNYYMNEIGNHDCGSKLYCVHSAELDQTRGGVSNYFHHFCGKDGVVARWHTFRKDGTETSGALCPGCQVYYTKHE